MKNRWARGVLLFVVIAMIGLGACVPAGSLAQATKVPTRTLTPTRTAAPGATATPSRTRVPTATLPPVISTGVPTPLPGQFIPPYSAAPLCPDSGPAHNNSLFHTLWDGVRGCHYDHEHGNDPYTAEARAAFPGFDLVALQGGVSLGHTNFSAPPENALKHGGFKFDVNLSSFHGCQPYQSPPNTIGIAASIIQYHNWGNYKTEFESRVHSAEALLKQCKPSAPNDFGWVYVVQHVDYGQRVVPYQGLSMPFPDAPGMAGQPAAWDSRRSPYFTMDCFGAVSQCRPSLQFVLDREANANSIWTSQPDELPEALGSRLFELLFRVRDIYQLLDWTDQTYPFTFGWLCSLDNGLTYTALPGCQYNNSTGRVHEVYGVIPSEWDNLAGFDTDPRTGRITGEGFVTATGAIAQTCDVPGLTCFPIKLVTAFVGSYGSQLIDEKLNQFSHAAQPERDIYFCGGVWCNEDDLGAVSSGWIGATN